MRIYITHCSAKKDDSLKDTWEEVIPDKLYKSKKTMSFISKCRKKQVRWAIFSDLYGVWFPEEKHMWYEKAPDTVSELEFENLVKNIDKKLQDFDEIWFYYNPGRFHPLYRRLLKQTRLKYRIKLFTHIEEII